LTVREDFIDVRSDRLWLSGFYLRMSSQDTGNSSTLTLHLGGALFLSDCVLEGRDKGTSRGIDVAPWANNDANGKDDDVNAAKGDLKWQKRRLLLAESALQSNAMED
jgi:hypothetical protein